MTSLGLRNKSLFSNYYVSQKLSAEPGWESESARAAFEAIKDLYARERRTLPGLTEAQLEEHFFRPAFEILGFRFEVAQKVEGISRFPDYAFFSTENEHREALEAKSRSGIQSFYDRTIAIGEVKQWDLELDRITKVESRDNPSFQIWLYLQQTRNRWGLLSNGRLWRLYSREHYFDAYFEIDLPRILEADDYPAFLFFFHFFSSQAFERLADGGAFLDKVLEKSRQQAREVGESLKVNVFNALKTLAQGFFEADTIHLDKRRPEDLQMVQRNSMRLLYRLLFILYAEGRGLFRDPRYFGSGLSLSELKDEVARRRDHDQPLLQGSTEFWDRLQRLFRVVDLGSAAAGFPEIEIPPYNGGLFDPMRNPFLAEASIGNRSIGEAIDLLSRTNLGDGRLGFVDYSTLEIRHLGSIYEGLLEYELRTASEPMVAVGEGLEWHTYSEYRQSRKRPLDFEDFHPEDRAPAGDLYISTAKGQRKSTGSYYTPESIVDYIVSSALGPVVATKRSEAAASGKPLHDAILELKVLDPAMGSGHFLLGAVDYIAAELVRAVQEDLAAGVRFDHPLETYTLDWAKRQVASRCAFGVDVNEMAVELAKVALWLHTIAQDKPLSFLDHHLKCGNSLIGARIVDLAWLPGERPKGVQAQVDKPLGLVEKILERLRAISAVSDDTIEDVKRKDHLFAELLESDEYLRIKTLADVHLGLDFSSVDRDAIRKPYQGLVNEAYYGNPPEWGQKSGASWVRPLLSVGRDIRFFHWELEFPEAFFEPGGLKSDPGFDCVIGNPPYIRIQDLPHGIVDFFKRPEQFAAATLRVDISVLFFERALSVGNSSAIHSYIASSQFMKADYGVGLRSLLGRLTFTSILDLADARVFEEALTYTAVFWFRKDDNPEVRFREIHVTDPKQVAERLAEFQPDEGWIVLKGPQLDGRAWVFQESREERIMLKLAQGSRPLGKVASIEYGVLTGRDDVMIVEIPGAGDTLERQVLRKIVWPDSLGRWALKLPKTHVIYPYTLHNGEAVLIGESELRQTAPHVMSYLESHREILGTRRDSREKFSERGAWYALVRYSHPETIAAVKILCPGVSKQPKFALDKFAVAFIGKGVTGIVPQAGTEFALLGLLNSRLVGWVMDAISPIKAGGYRTYSGTFLAKVPVKDVLVARINDRDLDTGRRLWTEIVSVLSRDPEPTSRRNKLKMLAASANTPEVRVAVLSLVSEKLYALRSEADEKSEELRSWLEAEILRPKLGKSIETVGAGRSLANLLELVRDSDEAAFDRILGTLRQKKVYSGPIPSGDRDAIRAEFLPRYSRVREIGLIIGDLEFLVDRIVEAIYELDDDEIRSLETVS